MNKKIEKNNNIQTQKKNVFTMITIGILFAFLVFFCLFLIIMLVWAFNTSLKSHLDFDTFGHNVLGLPNLDGSVGWNSRKEFFELLNFQKVLDNMSLPVSGSYYIGDTLIPRPRRDVGFFEMVLNTLIYCGLGAFCNVAVYTITGYLCSKYKEFKFGRVVEAVIIIFMSIPTVSTQPAEIKFMRETGLFDTWLGHAFLSSSFGGVYALVFIATFRGMPDAYIEAAEIDGASQLRTFLLIAIPMQIKLMTTVFLLNFISYWNLYESPLMFFPTHPTLAVGISKVDRLTQDGMETVPAKLASCMLLAVPIFILFCFLNKKIMAKVSLGGIKE